MPRLALAGSFAALFTVSACTDPSDPAAGEDSTGAGTSTGDAPDPTTGIVDPTTGIVDPTTGIVDPTTTTGEPETTAPSTTTTTADPGTTSSTSDDTPSSTSDDDTTTDATTGDDGLAPVLPTATGSCPNLVDGVVSVHPVGLVEARSVRIWLDPDVAAVKDGPVYFYWHGTGGEPEEALSGLGDLGIQEVLDAGGIVVAPEHDPGAGIFPWYLVLGEQDDDLRVADEVLACAHAQIGVDATRIHSIGFSAGGLHTAQMSVRRSNYLASVTTYSGGLLFGSMPGFAEPANDFPAMIFHGGDSDVVVVGFKQASADYAAYLADNGDFSFTCDHGMGHNIPHAQDSVMQFFADHPWGAAPEPYIAALPDGFPDYCALP